MRKKQKQILWIAGIIVAIVLFSQSQTFSVTLSEEVPLTHLHPNHDDLCSLSFGWGSSGHGSSTRGCSEYWFNSGNNEKLDSLSIRMKYNKDAEGFLGYPPLTEHYIFVFVKKEGADFWKTAWVGYRSDISHTTIPRSVVFPTSLNLIPNQNYLVYVEADENQQIFSIYDTGNSVTLSSEVECLDGDVEKYTCPDGTQVDWCTCVGNEWSCILSPENVCPEVKINVYRFSDNQCTLMNILPTERTINDFDTLAECQANIVVEECTTASDCEGKSHIAVPGYWECIDNNCIWKEDINGNGEDNTFIIFIIILIGGLIGLLVYLLKWMKK